MEDPKDSLHESKTKAQQMAENRLLVLEQQRYRLAQVDRANDVLDSKAMSLLQIATGGLILVGLLSPDTLLFFIPPFGLIMILTVVMIFPKDTYTPGPKEWEIIDEYIYTDGDCLLQVLSDCVEAADRLSTINESKSKTVKWLFGLIFIYYNLIFWAALGF